MERGLKLFATGEDALELKDRVPQCGKERSRNARSRDLAFSEVPWGGAAREFMEAIKKLRDPHWASIYNNTADFMGRSEPFVDYDGHFRPDEYKEADRPRTLIQIDW